MSAVGRAEQGRRADVGGREKYRKLRKFTAATDCTSTSRSDLRQNANVLGRRGGSW